jgi:hypothetical protein
MGWACSTNEQTFKQEKKELKTTKLANVTLTLE